MKIQVLGRELQVTLFRKKNTAIVVLEAGAWLPHNEAVLKEAATTIMTDILMPIARHGDLVEVYAKTGNELHEVKCVWAGCEAIDVAVTDIGDWHPRAAAIAKGLVERSAFIHMRKWLGQSIPEHCI